MRALLSAADRAALAEALPGWSIGARALERDFVFADFRAAWGFLTEVALLAERHDHHPTIETTYNRVRLRWETHDAGGLTALDRRLAAAVDRLAEARGLPARPSAPTR